MIVSPRDDRLLLVRQVDHQEQCAAMARAWGNAGFVRPEPYEPIVTATRVHDEGWREWERAPTAGPDGRPTDFVDIDRPTHVRLYAHGIRRASELDARAGLLVSMHGQGLYERRRGLDPGPVAPRAGREAAVRAFLDEQEQVQAGLRSDLGGGPGLEAWSWAGYRLLQAWDLMSLVLVWRPPEAGEERTLPQVPRHLGDPGVTLTLRPDGPWGCTCDPWPFAAPSVDLPVAGRFVEDRPYAGDQDLRRALRAAPAMAVAFTVRAEDAGRAAGPPTPSPAA